MGRHLGQYDFKFLFSYWMLIRIETDYDSMSFNPVKSDDFGVQALHDLPCFATHKGVALLKLLLNVLILVHNSML
jgi:hypothetical protein